MYNPLLLLARCYRAWRDLQIAPEVFSLRDASMHLRLLLQPQRLSEWELRRYVRHGLEIRDLPDGLREVKVKGQDLAFYWRGTLGGGLASGVLQEFDPRHPHYYTTPPVRLAPSSLVLDVGSCEGLFAFRATKRKEAAKVICFEPSARTAEFLLRGAEKNGVADKIEIEICAVGRTSGQIFFTDTDTPEANRVVRQGEPNAVATPQVSLDDYCAGKSIRLTRRDLIKVDAEGADVDVIKGAERIIRESSPQIAVTTYHNPSHASELIHFLKALQPEYQFRLKGLTVFGGTKIPRPVLLQASLRSNSGNGE